MYKTLSEEVCRQITEDRASGAFYGTPDSAAVRAVNKPNDKATVFRPPFVRDIGKIINLPVYSRMQDKTQVLSLYRDDDISRRMLHVQIVARIARDISRALGFNVDLTEAIALGHDIGHTPFGHAGERMLNSIMSNRYGLYFNHNVQSVRALTVIYPVNVTVQTLDGILCHNGESPSHRYTPDVCGESVELRVEKCEKNGGEQIKKLVPQTIEGCVVRVSDIIAYLGKDRQDALKLGLVNKSDFDINKSNSEIINNLSVDIIEHSYAAHGKYLSMSIDGFALLTEGKRDNYNKIYIPDAVSGVYKLIEPMFVELFDIILDDCKSGGGFTYKYHTEPIARYNKAYLGQSPERVACDFIASMTDDFFIAAYEKLTGKDSGLVYKGYFE